MNQRKKPKSKTEATAQPPWLDQFGILDTNHPLVKVLRVTDEKGKVLLAAISPEGLKEVLLDLLELAGTWSEFSPQTLQADGPTRALPASHISITKGREPTEAAVTLHVGPMPLVFLLPVVALKPELERVAAQVGRIPGSAPLQ